MTTTDIWSETYYSEFTESDIDSFKQIVISDIKNQTSTEDKTILSNNLSLWNYNLQVLRRDMELQLACQKAKTRLQISSLQEADQTQAYEIRTFINEQEKWRMSALKFLSNIEKKSLYVKLLISESVA